MQSTTERGYQKRQAVEKEWLKLMDEKQAALEDQISYEEQNEITTS